ncbi:MAG: hydrogenase iron-sulfur subunit [bacterium]|nr:hydrogenase iron-sulfur subunit [bacterium]
MREPTTHPEWQPRVVAFLCNWCSYTGADLAGISRLPWSPAVHIVRVMCSGRLDPTFVVRAFRMGADGVIVSGCHPGDCHYQKGNYKALRRVHLLKRLLADFGVEPERLRLVWVSASEGGAWAKIANEMEATVRRLGPLRLEPDPRRDEACIAYETAPEAEIPPGPPFSKGGAEVSSSAERGVS